MKMLRNDPKRRKILVRIEEDIYLQVKKLAEEENKSLTLKMNELLREAINEDD